MKAMKKKTSVKIEDLPLKQGALRLDEAVKGGAPYPSPVEAAAEAALKTPVGKLPIVQQVIMSAETVAYYFAYGVS